MGSKAKLVAYVSENELSATSSEGEGFDDVYGDVEYSQPNRKSSQSGQLSKKTKGKLLSKNAQMARENRLRKKKYISDMEKEVSMLKIKNSNNQKVIESQSLQIADLKKERIYLKSVILNSEDIGRLIKCVRRSTGMSVSTPMEQTLSLNDCISKPKQPIARKTAHSWDEKPYPNYPTPESDFLGLADLNNDLLSDFKIDDFMEEGLLDSAILEDNSDPLKEHNYTTVTGEEKHDVGVCLHVSKHRVSLEFCSICSDNASNSWD